MTAVQISTFRDVLEKLWPKRMLALDTETQGLRAYHGDNPFSLILADAEDAYYFNWNDLPDIPREYILSNFHWSQLRSFLNGQRRVILMHNASFDMSMLANAGISLNKPVLWDTAVGARLEHSDQMSYSLEACAVRIGEKKLDAVKQYITDHHLWAWADYEGVGARKKLLHYDQVPWDLIVPYGCQDALVTYKLGRHQLAAIRAVDKAAPKRCAKLKAIRKLESSLIKTVFHVEQRGVLVDRDFCQRALVAEERELRDAVARFVEITGRSYKASPKLFGELWGSRPEVPETKKGNPSFEGEVMEELARAGVPGTAEVLRARQAKARLNYYHGFLHHADAEGRIHTHFNSGGTKTGRFASASPNLQNIAKADEEELADEFVVRRAIIPTPGFIFFMPDMDQAEYRLLLDYAGAKPLIAKVLGGLDVHEATAQVAGITRKQAKTANFATLYGSGIKNLSKKLGVEYGSAEAIVAAIFEAAPEIPRFITLVEQTAKARGYVANWLGRRWHLTDDRFAYRAPNAVIQGGVGDIVKKGMVRTDKWLRSSRLKSRLVLNVHDQLVYEISKAELEITKHLLLILENVYPHRHLPLTWSASWSDKSLADEYEGHPV